MADKSRVPPSGEGGADRRPKIWPERANPFVRANRSELVSMKHGFVSPLGPFIRLRHVLSLVMLAALVAIAMGLPDKAKVGLGKAPGAAPAASDKQR